jgi:Rho-associated protein kinase 2
VAKWQKETQELQTAIIEESQARVKLQMELDSKDSEIEQLQGKLATQAFETASISSADNDNDDYSQGRLNSYTINYTINRH